MFWRPLPSGRQVESRHGLVRGKKHVRSLNMPGGRRGGGGLVFVTVIAAAAVAVFLWWRRRQDARMREAAETPQAWAPPVAPAPPAQPAPMAAPAQPMAAPAQPMAAAPPAPPMAPPPPVAPPMAPPPMQAPQPVAQQALPGVPGEGRFLCRARAPVIILPVREAAPPRPCAVPYDHGCGRWYPRCIGAPPSSRGPGRHPFKVETAVRIRLGVPSGLLP